MASEPAPRRITRDDIEAKLREVRSDAEDTGRSAKNVAVTVAGAAGFVVVLLAFVFGKRRGRRQSTTVEIRRV